MNAFVHGRRRDFWKGLRESLCPKNGALLILDEVKTGAKMAGVAPAIILASPDMIALRHRLRGSRGRVWRRKQVMQTDQRSQGVFTGARNTKRAMAAGRWPRFAKDDARKLRHTTGKIVEMTEGLPHIRGEVGMQRTL